MIRLALVLSLAIVALLLTPGAPASAANGTGEVTIARLPWLDGQQRQLTQGWFGHNSHYGQFGEDFANSGNSFTVLGATESLASATCTEWSESNYTGSGGTYVKVVRIAGGLTDYYFHLQEGICSSYPKHLEQGDVIGTAFDTGVGVTGKHLHYEPRTGSGGSTSVEHSLSGIDNFCDHNDSGLPANHDGEIGYQCAEGHHNEWYTSDNAGPGVGAPSPINGQIWSAYYAPHYWGVNAWDLYGSSMKVGTVGPQAFRYIYAYDDGWHQWFQRTDGVWHGFNRPVACNKAYNLPDQFFLKWFFNAGSLGQARSSVHQDDFGGFIPGIGPGLYQFFRWGFLYQPGGSGTVQVFTGTPFTNCYA